ncbi:MAG: ribonuclease P protein component [Bacilli bacterium]|nr:ribonuclease P protein component [Bacilli bacterium]
MKVKNRIKKYNEFEKVIHEGKLLRSDFLTLYFLKNELGYARVGISIPTKSGNAVVRNKIKRQIRAVLAKELDLGIGFDLIFIARKSYDIENKTKISADIVTLLKEVGNK